MGSGSLDLAPPTSRDDANRTAPPSDAEKLDMMRIFAEAEGGGVDGGAGGGRVGGQLDAVVTTGEEVC